MRVKHKRTATVGKWLEETLAPKQMTQVPSTSPVPRSRALCLDRQAKNSKGNRVNSETGQTHSETGQTHSETGQTHSETGQTHSETGQTVKLDKHTVRTNTQ